MRDYLIYTSAGSTANIKQWAATSCKNYDIWVTNYTGISFLNKEYADYYNENKGSKFQNLKAVFLEQQDLLSKYKAIMVLDDDIVISSKSLSNLFITLTDNKLWMLQPAFSRFGKISHKLTKRKLLSSLRYTNFIEVGCPIFRTDKLLDFLKIYNPEMSSCFGLDYWFTWHFGINKHNKYAISDKFFCINPYELFKSCTIREIDTLNSHKERVLMWERIKREIGVKQFKHQEYKKIQNTLLEIICLAPLFALEQIFSKLFFSFKKASLFFELCRRKFF